MRFQIGLAAIAVLAVLVPAGAAEIWPTRLDLVIESQDCKGHEAEHRAVATQRADKVIR